MRMSPGIRRLIAYACYLVVPFAIAFQVFNSTLLARFAAPTGLNIVQLGLWGIPFGLLCIALALRPIWILVNPLTLLWGRLSYSLYLTHPSIVFLLYKLGVYQAIVSACGGIPFVSFWIIAIVTIAVVSAVSWITFTFIEAPGMALGRSLASGAGARQAILSMRRSVPRLFAFATSFTAERTPSERSSGISAGGDIRILDGKLVVPTTIHPE
jgi:peptidoglycan/LPS O-acetylase OafA/YrhL